MYIFNYLKLNEKINKRLILMSCFYLFYASYVHTHQFFFIMMPPERGLLLLIGISLIEFCEKCLKIKFVDLHMCNV